MSNPDPSEYERLVRFAVAPARRFALAIARYVDSRVRDDLIQKVKEDVEKAGETLVVVDVGSLLPDGDLVEHLRAASEGAGKTQVLFAINLDHLLIDASGKALTTAAIDDFNRRRDALPDLIDTHIVIWLSEPAATVFASAARDVHDIALTFFRFEGREAPSAMIHRFGELPFWIDLASAEEVPRLRREAALLRQIANDPSATEMAQADALSRIGQIEVLLGDAPRGLATLTTAAGAYAAAGDPNLEALLRMRIGNILINRGDCDGALANYQAARSHAEEDNNPFKQAVANLHVASALHFRGDFDEALRIVRESVLPVFEQSGNEGVRAAALSQIADSLTLQGHTDEALRIRREEEMPIYERIGDHRSRALTVSQIADIFISQGQVEEALRIYREETLPVLTKTGDRRSAALERDKIALLLRQRNRPGDVEEARQLLREAIVDAQAMGLAELPILRQHLDET